VALSNILNPPIHTEFLLRGSAAVIDEDTILGYDPPLPDLLSRTDYVILKIDATPRQTHRMQQDVPEYPIETGFNIVDDVQRKPKRLTIDGIISDVPSDLLASLIEPVASLVRGESLSITAWQILKGLMGEQVDGVYLQPDLVGQPFDVVTGLDLYTNMIIENLTVTRTSDTGEALWFSASLKEIRTVSSETISTGAGTGRPIGSGGDADRGRVSGETPSSETSAGASEIAGGIL